MSSEEWEPSREQTDQESVTHEKVALAHEHN